MAKYAATNAQAKAILNMVSGVERLPPWFSKAICGHHCGVVMTLPGAGRPLDISQTVHMLAWILHAIHPTTESRRKKDGDTSADK
jgi:hypothetical protein